MSSSYTGKKHEIYALLVRVFWSDLINTCPLSDATFAVRTLTIGATSVSLVQNTRNFQLHGHAEGVKTQDTLVDTVWLLRSLLCFAI